MLYYYNTFQVFVNLCALSVHCYASNKPSKNKTTRYHSLLFISTCLCLLQFAWTRYVCVQRTQLLRHANCIHRSVL